MRYDRVCSNKHGICLHCRHPCVIIGGQSMYRVLYFDYMGLFDVSFGFNSQHEARKYAQKHSVELQQEIGRKVRFSIKKS